MKKKIRLCLLILASAFTINYTLSAFLTEQTIVNKFNTIDYNISLNGSGGTFNAGNIVVKNHKATIPIPTRNGYNFVNYKLGGTNEVFSQNILNIDELNNKELVANWDKINYSISYNLNGGSSSNLQYNYNVENNSFTLPTPTRTGYTFTGWTGTGLNSATKNVTINKGSTGNRSYTANWNVNYYTVNYYVNGNLWTQRSVAYGSALENLNPQSSLDRFHKFNYWDGFISSMPNYNVNLYANITQSYCALITGHGPYGNAEALLRVFQNAGWSGRIEPAPSAPGNYWVVTDYNLTREQAEIQKNYVAEHTNYRNYNYPYLYWVSVDCTNGIGDTWTRGSGQKTFTSIY